jgi:hypothetical protein
MMERIHKQLGEFQEVSRGLSNAQQSLESVLGGVKTRGILGEVTLDRLLEDSLPSSQYGTQYRFASGEAVDAVIFLRDKKLLAVDSKFPLEAFRRIQTDGDEARRSFASAVKGHADSIAKKYIRPDENTLDLALMFVPSESVYYELLQTSDSKGQALDEYCREKRIVAVSPNTLYAHLSVIAMGLIAEATGKFRRFVRQSRNAPEERTKQLSGSGQAAGPHGTGSRRHAQQWRRAGRRANRTAAEQFQCGWLQHNRRFEQRRKTGRAAAHATAERGPLQLTSESKPECCRAAFR